MKQTTNQFSYGDFVWWVGKVEDVNDPDQSGRVKVRIFGYHSQDKNQISLEHLPWAQVSMPTTGASTNGIGHSPHALIKDSIVLGFFLDGSSAQIPMVIFSFHGLMDDGIPDINKLARGEIVKKEATSAGTWSEKLSGAKPVYPHNKVYETTSGHIIELDDSSGNERIHIYHKSGTFIEVHKDGTIVKKTVADNYDITLGNSNIYVKGNMNLNVDGNVVETIKGNKTSNITGNYNITCNSYTLKTKASMTMNLGSTGTIKCGGSLTCKASKIMLN